MRHKDPLHHCKTMICLLCLLYSASLVQSTGNASVASDEVSSSAQQDQLIPFQEECVAHVTYSISEDGGHEAELKCAWDNGISYLIPSASKEWISEQMILGELVSAETIITLPSDAMLNEYTHEILLKEPPKLWNYEMEERNRRRKLRRLATTGSKSVLVVRVQATDGSTTPTPAQIGNHVFGDDGNDYNFKYQTEACSHNKLIITKARDRRGRISSISNGIVTVDVNIPATSGELPMQNAVTWALNTEFGINNPSVLADHIMYCFPTGTTSKLAYAEVGGYLSYYNNEACTYPSAALHEIGHNYNLGHSSDKEYEYGDKSGLMGFVYWYTYQPKMCYNAAKSWQLGWYASKAESIAPSARSPTYSTRLAGVVNYSTTSNKVLIEIQQTTSPTFFYVNYNRATGINSGTQEGANQVLVVSKDTSVESNVSLALASLASGQSYQILKFNGNNAETLTITFSSIVGNEAVVDIVLTGFTLPSSSPSAVPSLAPSTSNLPSLVPSQLPSVSVEPSLSIHPSSEPSSSDQPSTSNAPSKEPSAVPSAVPSNEASRLPSLSPSTTPSFSLQPTVSRMPSIQPSRTASASPSREPSQAPSRELSQAPSKQPVTRAPAANNISIQRSATISVEVGIAGLDNLEVLCNGIGAFLKQGIQDAYGPNTFSTVTCEQSRGGSRNLLVTAKNNIFRPGLFDYEKPVLFTITTTFSDYQTAPRQYGFADFLEQLIVSDKAQRELPKYIQNAVGGLAFIDGVHVRLVFTPKQEPILILGFGEDAPTPNPTFDSVPERVSSDLTGDNGRGGEYHDSSSGVVMELRLRHSLIICALMGGIMNTIL